MAYHIKKVRPRVECRRGRPRLVRYEWGLVLSAYGAAWGTSATRKGAEDGPVARSGRDVRWRLVSDAL